MDKEDMIGKIVRKKRFPAGPFDPEEVKYKVEIKVDRDKYPDYMPNQRDPYVVTPWIFAEAMMYASPEETEKENEQRTNRWY